MSTDEFDLTGPDLAAGDLLVLEDPRFGAGTVAVVTGAASGIGRATAGALAANGPTVGGADVDGAGLAETADLAADVDAPDENRSPGDSDGAGVSPVDEPPPEAVVRTGSGGSG